MASTNVYIVSKRLVPIHVLSEIFKDDIFNIEYDEERSFMLCSKHPPVLYYCYQFSERQFSEIPVTEHPDYGCLMAFDYKLSALNYYEDFYTMQIIKRILSKLPDDVRVFAPTGNPESPGFLYSLADLEKFPTESFKNNVNQV